MPGNIDVKSEERVDPPNVAVRAFWKLQTPMLKSRGYAQTVLPSETFHVAPSDGE